MTQNFQIIDNKKYVWDGKVYEKESDADTASEQYKKDNFEIQLRKEEDKYLVYTRRVAAATPTS